VTLPAAITKTKHKRFVNLSENAISWLEAYRRRGGNFHGPVVPFDTETLYKRHRANYRAAGITKWVSSGGRHCFASYWLAANHNDIDRLVILSGHTDKTVLWKHYYRATTKHEALKFWSILPPTYSQENIVNFTA
jgi:integrase